MTHPQQQSEPEQSPTRRKRLWIVGGIIAIIVVAVIVAATVLDGGTGGQGPVTQADGAPAGPPAPAPADGPAPPGGPAPAETPAPAEAPAPAVGEVTVTYEVSGDAERGNVTYSADENLNLSQQYGVALPWTAEVPFPGNFPLATLALTAQSGEDGPGEITCRILRDDEVISERTSSGPYAVVTCSGS